MRSVTVKNNLFILSLTLCAAVFVVDSATDIFTPALPLMKQAFATTDFGITLVVIIYLLGFAFSSILFGSLAEKYGRRPLFLAGAVLFALFTGLLSASLHSYTAFLISRLCQAIAAGYAAALGLTILGESCDEAQFVKQVSMISAVLMFVPVVAPLLGGLLIAHFGWQSCFYVLTIAAVLVALLSVFKVPETQKQPEPGSHKISVLSAYKKLLRDKQFLRIISLLGVASGGLWLLIALTPLIFNESFAITPSHYAYYFGLMISAGAVSSILCHLYAEKINLSLLIRFSQALLLVSVIPFVFLYLHYVDSVYWYILSGWCYCFAVTLLFNTLSERALGLHEEIMASASALLVCVEVLISAAITYIGINTLVFSRNYCFALALMLLLISIFCYVLYKPQNQKRDNVI